MLNQLRLIPALQVIFQNNIEFTPESFAELTEPQREAYDRKVGETTEKLYRILPIEPTVLERDEEKITLELTIVTESERSLLLDAVAFIYCASAEMKTPHPTFEQRLEYLRPRLPAVVIGNE